MPDRRPFLAPLSNDTFRNIWLASIVSNLGGLIQGVGAAWMMTSITSSENMVALVQASTTLPIMMFSLVAGAIADNFDRRRVMLIAQAFLFSVSALLAAAAYLDWISPWLLLTFTFLLGCGTALNNPAWQASVGDMVPRDDVAGAVSLNSMGFNLTRSVGPAIGGAIVAIGGAAAAFLVNAASYVALVTVLLRWTPPREARTLPREEIGQAIAAGLRYVSMSPNLLKVFTRGFVFGFSAVAILALLPVVARNIIGGGPLTYGLMLGGFGLGAVAGAYFNTGLRERMTSETIVRCSFAGFALSEAIMGATGNIVLIGIAVVIAGGCWVLALSLFNTIVQLSTPRWVVGRALSFYQMATFGGMAGGAWLWGSLAENYGVGNSFSIAALVTAGGLLIGFALPMPLLASLDLDPLNIFREPELQLDILPRSGPIAIHVVYEIRDEDVTEFLDLMVERRRIRIRDGAQAWALMRDLQNPQRWTETYHTPTWVDYVRHNIRRTKADAENLDRLRQLHQGGELPDVYRMIERQVIPPAGDVFHQIPVEPH
ncbi:MFS transporter [Rhizobium sp. TH2]|uniref:MFS transporter n=1 Tax=Rhizobium sp. TH2 TaxID=2775403 RepID=UPI0021576758|nr:MFS transporter [Rhizobium sp. TH2]UVC06661.1 MFS transporter [Rhizobium sp. TH2]